MWKLLPPVELLLILRGPGQMLNLLGGGRPIWPLSPGSSHNLRTDLLPQVMDFFVIRHAS